MIYTIISAIGGCVFGFVVGIKTCSKLIARGLASNPDKRKELSVALVNLDKNDSK